MNQTLETMAINQQDMGIDFESDLLQVFFEQNRQKIRLVSILIYWVDVYPMSGGIPDGEIEILGSNDGNIWTKLNHYNIQTTDNSDNAILFEFGNTVLFLKIKYTKNNIAFGNLSASVIYISGY